MVALLVEVVVVILVLDTHDVSAPQCTIGECYQSLFVDRSHSLDSSLSSPPRSITHNGGGSVEPSWELTTMTDATARP
ncbi:hypothetical protein PC116_g31080 [Phytophthora cactorum]|nr:hypothetical protein PC116_g31080 [Phytophthora cactorum]